MNGESVFKITPSKRTLLTVLIIINCLFVQLKTEHGDCSSRDINGKCSSIKTNKDEEHSFIGAHGSHRYSKGTTTTHTYKPTHLMEIFLLTCCTKKKRK